MLFVVVVSLKILLICIQYWDPKINSFISNVINNFMVFISNFSSLIRVNNDLLSIHNNPLMTNDDCLSLSNNTSTIAARNKFTCI